MISAMSKLSQLQPQPLFTYFEIFCKIPRPSKKEDRIRSFLLDFARSNNLEAKTDEAGNVLISKPAVQGKEHIPVVILQSHMDMVCEKNRDTNFDFEKDAIEPYLEDGWIKARGTTLGADCGIGMAAQLAVLSSDKIEHGPVECLFTVDEETGLTGAFALQPGFMSGSILLNLDSEDEGEIFIGCAGGIDTVASLRVQKEEISIDFVAFKISVTGLLGGHSGDDIDKNRGNAIKILTRFLWNTKRSIGIQLSHFEGGNLRNAIAREASAIVVLPVPQKKSLEAAFGKFREEIKFEFEKNEPAIMLHMVKTTLPSHIMSNESQNNLLNALYACPHGVVEMSTRMRGMVETSSNLASVKFDKNIATVTTSQRSEIESRKRYIAGMVRSVFELAEFDVKHSEGYPGWAPNPDSDILITTVASYKNLFGIEPLVRSIHAGLECGLFLKKYPYLDMVSFGPTIKGAHSPDERLNVKSTENFWKHLVDVLENIK
jgi:dipeptidase D